MRVPSILFGLLCLSGGSLAASVDDCPGYTATNVKQTATGLTADLTINGPACNVFGYDLGSLKLLVEHQTGENTWRPVYLSLY